VSGCLRFLGFGLTGTVDVVGAGGDCVDVNVSGGTLDVFSPSCVVSEEGMDIC
jgi:hypothetical protein